MHAQTKRQTNEQIGIKHNASGPLHRQGHNKIHKICVHVREIHQFGKNLSATALIRS